MGKPQDVPFSHSRPGLGFPRVRVKLTCSTSGTLTLLREVPTSEERAISVGLHRIHHGTLSLLRKVIGVFRFHLKLSGLLF